jgi:hypothetical protein
MSELPPNREEQPEEGREYEVKQLVDLNEIAQELFDFADRAGAEPPDVIFDVIVNLSRAMARRDPELGRLLVDKLTERAAERGPIAPSEAERHDDLNHLVYSYVVLPQQEAQAANPEQPPPACQGELSPLVHSKPA